MGFQKRTPAIALLAVVLATSGCYRGAATRADPAAVKQDPGWVRVEVPLVRQQGTSDCGVAALASVLSYYGVRAPLSAIEARLGGAPSRGVRAEQLTRYAREQGLEAFAFFGTVKDLHYELERGRPVIVGIAKPYAGNRALTHYLVIVGYEPRKERLLALDPADGLREYPLSGFLDEWRPTKRVAIVVMRPIRRDAPPRHDENAALSP
jgi:ABC-type bacteriocin/lantibiotic exporter with double-glycine peptidase domain